MRFDSCWSESAKQLCTVVCRIIQSCWSTPWIKKYRFVGDRQGPWHQQLGPGSFRQMIFRWSVCFLKNVVSNSVRFALWVFVLLSSDCFTRRRGRTPQEIAAMEPNGEGRAGDTNQKRRKRKSKCCEGSRSRVRAIGQTARLVGNYLTSWACIRLVGKLPD